MTNQMIANAYNECHERIQRYVASRINNVEDAKDLVQDVFVKLLDVKEVLIPNTLKPFIFTLTRNLINDYLRRHYTREKFDGYMMDYADTSTNETESTVVAKDIAELEERALNILPMQRRIVYTMRRYDGKSAQEIAEEMGLSQRTIENHLFMGMKQMRSYIKMCI